MRKRKTSENIVINGDFEKPDLGNRNWQYFDNIPGWHGFLFELGKGSFSNPKLFSGFGQVCELDSDQKDIKKEFLQQSWNMDANYNVVPATANQYTLSYEYACRNKYPTPLKSCRAKVIWNNEVVKEIAPEDYLIHKEYVQVESIGKNTLRFEEANGVEDDGLGLLFDNIALKHEGSDKNLIVNGDFESSESGFFESIPGWKGNKLIEVGPGN